MQLEKVKREEKKAQQSQQLQKEEEMVERKKRLQAQRDLILKQKEQQRNEELQEYQQKGRQDKKKEKGEEKEKVVFRPTDLSSLPSLGATLATSQFEIPQAEKKVYLFIYTLLLMIG